MRSCLWRRLLGLQNDSVREHPDRNDKIDYDNDNDNEDLHDALNKTSYSSARQVA